MQELVFWCIIVPLMATLACVSMLRQWRRDYPLSSGAVDYRRIAPSWKSGTVPDVTDVFPLKSNVISLPPQSVTSGVTDEMIAANNEAIISTGLKLVEHGYLTVEELRRDLASVDIVLPAASSGYTPLLNDDPYQADEPEEPLTVDEMLLKAQKHLATAMRDMPTMPIPQIDPKLIGKDYR